MRLAMVATAAAMLGLAACNDTQTANLDPYNQQEARRDANRLEPQPMPNPEESVPSTSAPAPSSEAPDPTDPNQLPPVAPPPVLPESPPS